MIYEYSITTDWILHTWNVRECVQDRVITEAYLPNILQVSEDIRITLFRQFLSLNHVHINSSPMTEDDVKQFELKHGLRDSQNGHLYFRHGVLYASNEYFPKLFDECLGTMRSASNLETLTVLVNIRFGDPQISGQMERRTKIIGQILQLPRLRQLNIVKGVMFMGGEPAFEEYERDVKRLAKESHSKVAVVVHQKAATVTELGHYLRIHLPV